MSIQEQAYLDLMSTVLETGYDKPNRTNTPTRSITGATLRFNLTQDDKMVIPLLTTKQTSFRLVATELLWFLQGDTSVKSLSNQNNHIWDANGSREFLDSRGFKFRMEGDLGPVYGWQWRHWNAPYVEIDNRTPEYKQAIDVRNSENNNDIHNSFGIMKDSRNNNVENRRYNTGIDQIANVIDSIRNDPWGRRHIVSAWNPEQLDQMSLPPCHAFFQFIVRPFDQHLYPCGDAHQVQAPYWLDCVLYQRSADLPLGVPFNIASYSLLTHMIAHVCGLRAGQLVHNMGDVHIYQNQFPGCETQITRTPGDFPELRFIEPPDNIDSWNMNNFVIAGYKHQGRIKFPFST